MKQGKNIILYHTLSSLYALGLSLWAGTIYLYMHQAGYSYGQIDLFLALFWLVTCLTEIPSGYLADRFGALKMTFYSALFRGSGLLLLASVRHDLIILVLSACLTALGDSLYSGTLTSWIVEQTKNQKLDQGKLFSNNYVLVSAVSFVGGYFGADLLGNIELKLPLISGAVILFLVGIIALFCKDRDRLADKNSPKKLPHFTFKGLLSERKLLKTMVLFLPLTFITVGPYNQWQLYFQHGRKIKTGLILVGIDLCGILGASLFPKVAKLKLATEKLFLAHVLAIALSVCLLVFSSNYYLAVAFMWFHVVLCALAEILQTKILHEQIHNELRTTWISVNNTLEALVTTAALALNGFIADRFGLGNAWLFLTLLGVSATFIWYGYQKKHA